MDILCMYVHWFIRCHFCCWLTCVLPPVVSWIRLRDMEAETEKHWKKPPTVLLRPNATSSCSRRQRRKKYEAGKYWRQNHEQWYVFLVTWLLSTLYPCFSANVFPSETDTAYPTTAKAKASPITSPKIFTSGRLGGLKLAHRDGNKTENSQY